MKPSFLMCDPGCFGIEYEINPWMHLGRQADRGLARKQWEALYGFLARELGFEVQVMEPVKGLPDMVFTANAGLCRERKFIPANFRNKERRGESRQFESWFRKMGYSIHNLPPELFFEGEGDVLSAGEEDAYAGYLIRSDVNSHTKVSALLGLRVISLELVDPRFYHLDTCFCPLGSQSLVYYPGAFDSYAREVIAENFPDRIEVTQEEAGQFVCNAIVVDNHYIQAEGGTKTLRRALEARGYSVREFGMSEFIKAGGAVKCLVLKL